MLDIYQNSLSILNLQEILKLLIKEIMPDENINAT